MIGHLFELTIIVASADQDGTTYPLIKLWNRYQPPQKVYSKFIEQFYSHEKELYWFIKMKRGCLHENNSISEGLVW